MKKISRLFCLFFTLLCVVFVGANTANAENDKIYLGGMPAGFFLETRGAYVAGLCDVITEKGLLSPSKDAGIEVGDTILYINDKEINNAKDIENVVKNDSEINVQIDRNGEIKNYSVKPVPDMNKKPKLGVFIREGINGIGTITYIKNNSFASLGHPVLDNDGSILNLINGKIYECNITGFIKGERGKPGELRGVFIRKNEKGTIIKNNECGVYGNLNKLNTDNLQEIEVGEGVPGNAYFITTTEGKTPQKYSISIVKVDKNDSVKNFVVKITDSKLLETTGGIVQGMSGSPIIQNGKLVGAITHVFVNDPSRGFGISVNNMLKN